MTPNLKPVNPPTYLIDWEPPKFKKHHPQLSNTIEGKLFTSLNEFFTSYGVS